MREERHIVASLLLLRDDQLVKRRVFNLLFEVRRAAIGLSLYNEQKLATLPEWRVAAP